ncbi:MAG: VWA domain-containing protein [Actinomycetota bacterium]|nr:VWA domain-containing protein [Actinomycetota bacterium]
MTSPAKVSPETISLTVTKSGVTYDDEVTVGIDPKGTIPTIDVYFLSDTTGSMGDIIKKVRKEAGTICTDLRKKAQEAKDVNVDLQFGVGNYRDFDMNNPTKEDRFHHQLSPSAFGDAVAEIGKWELANGDSTAEGQLYALNQLAEPPGGKLIGWRQGAKRIVVWFGDAPGHDPICKKVFPDLDDDITEESVIKKLRAEGIIVLAVSVLNDPKNPTDKNPGLNGDPIKYAQDGSRNIFKGCGFGGTPGQGTRIAQQTGGEFTDGIQVDKIVETIIHVGGMEVARVGKLSWIPDGTIAPFVIPPPAGETPVKAGQKEVKFGVKFGSVGVSTDAGPGSKVVGNVDIKADGVLIGQQKVTISTPDLTGKYLIQSEVNNKLYLQIKDVWGWEVNLAEKKEGQNSTLQHWQLITARPGDTYLINNLHPRADEKKGRFLEVADGEARENANLLTREGGPELDQHLKNQEWNKIPYNHQWRLIPMGADSNGVIYRIQSCAPRQKGEGEKFDYYCLDAYESKPDHPGDPRLTHYWANQPPFHKKHGQHWRLVAL